MSELNMATEYEEAGLHPERPLEVIEGEILFYKAQAGGAIIEIGRRLIEAKAQLEHGEWTSWLEERVQFSVRSAQRFMKLAEGYGESDTVTLLGTRKALALLALEESERAEFLAENDAENMSAAQLEQAIRERDEALRQLNEERAAGEGAVMKIAEAEEDRAKMAADMKFLNERLEGLNEEVTRKEQELAELRSRPVDVAVQYQTDPKELDLARAEAAQAKEAEMNARVEKAEKALAKAKAEREKAEAEQKRLQASLDNARVKITAVTEDLERLRREAQLAGDKELAQFTLLFEQGQETVKKMHGILQKMDYSGQKETADKLRKALAALAEQVRKVAEGAENEQGGTH